MRSIKDNLSSSTLRLTWNPMRIWVRYLAWERLCIQLEIVNRSLRRTVILSR